MHPAPSVIAFTSLSGIGFGMMFWLGIFVPPVQGLTAFFYYLMAYAFALTGLLASTLHLGHPERAIKAFTQWRSSWLSREAWAAVATLVVMALAGFAQVFLSGPWALIGLIGAALALFTVFTTSMIYTQLKTIPRWNLWITPLYYLSFALAGGAVVLEKPGIAIPMLLIAGIVQIGYWIMADKTSQSPQSTLGSATGLGDRGQVRAFEPPHTSPNYLNKEFMFHVGRKHAQKLRIIALALGFGLPILCYLIGHNWFLWIVAVVSHLMGVLASRWLFFAEAEHVVGLYYGNTVPGSQFEPAKP